MGMEWGWIDERATDMPLLESWGRKARVRGKKKEYYEGDAPEALVTPKSMGD
jgi:hypothetical protein